MPVYNKRLKQDKSKKLTMLLMLYCFHLATKQKRQQYIDIQDEGLYAEIDSSFLTKKKSIHISYVLVLKLFAMFAIKCTADLHVQKHP